MTLDEYQIKALQTAVPKEDVTLDRTVWALGITGQAGSLGENWRKIVAYKNGEMSKKDREELARDAGDILWHLAVFLERLGITLEDVAKDNIRKAKTRKARAIAKAVESER